MSAVVQGDERLALDVFKREWPFAHPPLVMDVGANVGDYIHEVLERFPRAVVMAFEPQDGARRQLINRFAGHRAVAILRYALSSEPGAAVLRASSHESCVLATLHDREDADSYHGSGIALSRREEVELVTLDDVAPPWVDWLKIDVEGHELEVLKGGIQTLGSTSVVQFEYNDCAGVAGVRFADLHELLTTWGFTLWLEHEDGLELVQETSAHEWKAGDSTRNYLAVNSKSRWFSAERWRGTGYRRTNA